MGSSLSLRLRVTSLSPALWLTAGSLTLAALVAWRLPPGGGIDTAAHAYKIGGARWGATAPHLAGTCVEHVGRDRSCVHVETDERKLTHAAPPRNCGSATARCGDNPRQLTWWGAASLHTV